MAVAGQSFMDGNHLFIVRLLCQSIGTSIDEEFSSISTSWSNDGLQFVPNRLSHLDTSRDWSKRILHSVQLFMPNSRLLAGPFSPPPDES